MKNNIKNVLKNQQEIISINIFTVKKLLKRKLKRLKIVKRKIETVKNC